MANQPKPHNSAAERGIALGLACAVVAVLIFLVVNPRAMDNGNLAIVRFLAALTSGLSGYLFVGNLGLEARLPFNKAFIRATGGFAAFIAVFLLFYFGIPTSSSSSSMEQGKASLWVGVTNEPLPFETDNSRLMNGFAPERTLSYRANYNNEEVEIIPQMKYLEDLKSGETIYSTDSVLGTTPYFKWEFPNLDLRITNNINRTIYINDVILEVERSVLDTSPVLLIPRDESNLFHAYLVNEGWGETKNGFMKVNIAHRKEEIQFNGQYQYEKKLGSFELSDGTGSYTYNIDFSDTLNSLELNTQQLVSKLWKKDGSHILVENFEVPNCTLGEEKLVAALVSELKSRKATKEDARQTWDYCTLLGDFQKSLITRDGKESKNGSVDGVFAAFAYGEISFSGIDPNEKVQEYSFKFVAEVPLVVPGGYGDHGPPTHQYNTKLEVGRQNYKVFAQSKGSSVSQYIKSGETDRFTILVGADKSASHTFRIRLMYNDGQSLLSPPITLYTFVPRSESGNSKKLGV